MQAILKGIQQRAQSLFERTMAPVSKYLRLIDQQQTLVAALIESGERRTPRGKVLKSQSL
jgi:hypothetical protein